MSLPPWGARSAKPAKADPVTAQTRALVVARSLGRCRENLCKRLRREKQQK